jgi:hypothetical protein
MPTLPVLFVIQTLHVWMGVRHDQAFSTTPQIQGKNVIWEISQILQSV